VLTETATSPPTLFNPRSFPREVYRAAPLLSFRQHRVTLIRVFNASDGNALRARGPTSFFYGFPSLVFTSAEIRPSTLIIDFFGISFHYVVFRESPQNPFEDQEFYFPSQLNTSVPQSFFAPGLPPSLGFRIFKRASGSSGNVPTPVRPP